MTVSITAFLHIEMEKDVRMNLETYHYVNQITGEVDMGAWSLGYLVPGTVVDTYYPEMDRLEMDGVYSSSDVVRCPKIDIDLYASFIMMLKDALSHLSDIDSDDVFGPLFRASLDRPLIGPSTCAKLAGEMDGLQDFINAWSARTWTPDKTKEFGRIYNHLSNAFSAAMMNNGFVYIL